MAALRAATRASIRSAELYAPERTLGRARDSSAQSSRAGSRRPAAVVGNAEAHFAPGPRATPAVVQARRPPGTATGSAATDQREMRWRARGQPRYVRSRLLPGHDASRRGSTLQPVWYCATSPPTQAERRSCDEMPSHFASPGYPRRDEAEGLHPLGAMLPHMTPILRPRHGSKARH